ncbi:AraC-like DNA-binding protein [Kribbella sp. VKM Ac-2527]|uniref:AraC-like DNA-binding protein n=2 Tax=Kribbella caucasensis TaxID=2512215 RepID=A0A4R6K8D5_9ACTN|nr:AraC-like DNA-binding protein [Kribbella sp. VKM Ac-2527]
MSDRSSVLYAGLMSRVSPPSDDLAEVLKAINVRSTILCRSHFTAPWGFRVDGSDLAKFHIVLDGAAWLELDSSAESHRLDTGAIVLLPRGTGHVVRDDPRTPVRHLEAILTDHPLDSAGRLRYGGDGASTTVLCGAFEGVLLPDDMTDLLPAALVLDQDGSSRVTRWLQPIADLLASDSTAPGDAAVLAKVADVFLTEFLRQYLAQQEAALVHLPTAEGASAPVAAALRLMRRDPRAQWTVEGLARQVGMSRTAFATRFRDSVGEPPLSHLTRVRLSQGAGYLATTSRTIGAIARDVGYDNESSFSKAFKRVYGCSPGAFRTEWSP